MAGRMRDVVNYLGVDLYVDDTNKRHVVVFCNVCGRERRFHNAGAVKRAYRWADRSHWPCEGSCT